ncbi:MAG: hypothetical protein J3K34DRAFT_417275 [Monoraphidium minutum]|nr:MAG: hypothetical protein J3K34DRAFT_417275 [Monoraphidium minutum]
MRGRGCAPRVRVYGVFSWGCARAGACAPSPRGAPPAGAALPREGRGRRKARALRCPAPPRACWDAACAAFGCAGAQVGARDGGARKQDAQCKFGSQAVLCAELSGGGCSAKLARQSHLQTNAWRGGGECGCVCKHRKCGSRQGRNEAWGKYIWGCSMGARGGEAGARSVLVCGASVASVRAKVRGRDRHPWGGREAGRAV